MTDQPPPPPPGSSGGYEPPPAPAAPGGSYPPPAAGSYSPPPPLPGGGVYPPPPPSAGGYAPPPPGPAIRTLPQDSYTPWFTRVLAYIIDWLPYGVVVGIGAGIQAVTTEQTCVGDATQSYGYQVCTYQPSAIGMAVFWLAIAVGLAYAVWNLGYRQGTTGSSVGKSVMKFKVVSEATGEPIGFASSVLRQLAHFVDAIICYIGFLFPLWDAKRQTLADKIMTTVCLPL
jgi:uncharacterized RDD family membrane protein YckC